MTWCFKFVGFKHSHFFSLPKFQKINFINFHNFIQTGAFF